MRERELFIEALQKTSLDERAAYLNGASAGDENLRRRVERLLEEHQRQESFIIDSPPPGIAGTLAQPPVEGPGTQIGPYKLLEQIGEGGMGVVFMAEQHEPVRRRVALKVIKPGMDTRQVIARFEAERQALAVMDHPNMAKVFDAGETASGRPYFVMELVKGLPITDYCDQAQLTPRKRLELFVSVCQAVQHAHQKGIIHRDLKPTNVLVTAHEGPPSIKVIDFGVAKATGGQLTDKTLFTGFAQMIGTPLYMSPEQAGQSPDIDTRSDIYSLGVLLYELLTGTTPFDKERFQQAAYEEIRRIIREEDPPKPSTRLSESKDTLPSIGAQRQTEPLKLAKLVRGELDWVVMKALDKDRNRRYETANGFAADVQRYLNDEPVVASPPSAAYRIRKFARRNKGPVLAVSLVALALVGGTVGAIWGLVQVEQARQVEVQERERAEANLQLARKAVDELHTELSGELGDVPRMQPLQRKFLLRALDFYKTFAQQKGADPATRFGTALAYVRVAGIQLHLGGRSEAIEARQKAILLLENLVEEFPDETQYRAALASAYISRGSELVGISPVGERRDAHRDAVAILEQIVGDSPSVVDYQIRLSSAYMNLGSRPDLQLQEAEQALQEAIRLCTKLVAEFPDQSVYKLQLANCHYCLGYALAGRGRNEAAEKSYRNVLDLCSTSDDALSSLNQKWLLALGHSGLAVVLAATSRADEAERACREAIRLRSKIVVDFPDVPNYLNNLADDYNRLGILLHNARRFTESAEARLKAAGMYEKLAAQFPSQPVYAMLQAEMYCNLVDTYELDNRRREVKEAWVKVVQLYDTSAAPILSDPTNEALHATAYFQYARGLAVCNRPREAEQACYVGLKLQENLEAKSSPKSLGHPGPSSRLATLHHLLGRLFQASARPQEAEKAYRKALEWWPARAIYHNDLAWLLVTYPDPRIHKPAEAVGLAKKACGIQPQMYNVWNTLGVAHYRAEEYRDAIAALKKSDELGRGIEFGFNALFIAMCYGKLGEEEQSRQWYDKAVKWQEKHPTKGEELERFRKEAELLLGVKDPTK